MFDSIMFTKIIAFTMWSACTLMRVHSQHLLESSNCPEHGEHTFHHPELCDHFILCVNGSLSVEQCENGLLYDGKGNVHNHCNYFWDVECGNKKADVRAESSPGCEFRFGIGPESEGCSTNYIKCAEGYPNVQQCEPGLAYSDKIKKCTWPDEMLDTCNPEAIVGFKCPEKVDPHSPQARFWPYPRFAVPNDCERLITCVNGYPRLNTCGDGKVFDDQTLTCLEPEEVSRCSHFRKR